MLDLTKERNDLPELPELLDDPTADLTYLVMGPRVVGPRVVRIGVVRTGVVRTGVVRTGVVRSRVMRMVRGWAGTDDHRGATWTSPAEFRDSPISHVRGSWNRDDSRRVLVVAGNAGVPRGVLLDRRKHGNKPAPTDRSAAGSGSAGVFVGVSRGFVVCRWWHDRSSMAVRRSARKPVGKFANTSMSAVRVL